MRIRALLTPHNIIMTDFDTLNPLSVLGYIVSYRRLVYDRYDYLNKYISIDTYKCKTPPSINDTKEKYIFSDLMDERANNLIEQYKGKKFIIFCSGGVDSTAMLCAFLKHNEIKDDIIIVSNNTMNNSKKDTQLEGFVNEYPYFYNYLKNNNYNFLENEYTLVKDIENIKSNYDYVLLSGDCCDQLFGSQFNYEQPQYYERNWKDALLEVLDVRYYNIDPHWIDIYQEWINNTIKFDIKNFGQFTWFLNFSLKFEAVKWDIPLLYSSDLMLHNFINFYDTEKFQLYSLQNFYKVHNINPYRPENKHLYKKVIKEYVYNYNKDEDFLKNKSKQASNLIVDDSNNITIIDDKNHLHILNLKEDLKKFNMKLYFRINYKMYYDKKRP